MGLFQKLFGLKEPTDFAKAGTEAPAENSLNEDFTGSLGGSMPGFGYDSTVGFQGNPSFGLGGAIGGEGNFIGDSFWDVGGVFTRAYGNPGLQEVEKSYIMHQRAISLYPEVAIGIEEIMRDLFLKDDPLVLETEGEDDKQFEVVNEIFNEFKKKPFVVINGIKTPDALITFNFLKQAYIDGRMCVLSLAIDASKFVGKEKANAKNMHGMSGTLLNESMVHWKSKTAFINPDRITEKDVEYLIESANDFYEPLSVTKDGAKTRFDKKTGKAIRDPKGLSDGESSENQDNSNKIRVFIPIDPLKVVEQDGVTYYQAGRSNKMELKPEQVIQSDFGLFDVTGARHGFLLYAFKYANQLQALQDMLIPMRFRRSVARRVFNVDISNLPQNRALAYMQDLQTRFKYKKRYDATSGKIVSTNNEPTGIVEDYWFANRSGSKGTTVETIDEAGNFQDSLDDIMYFNKKLYQSMFIPLRRIFESEASYDYTANSIEVDELRFVNFLDRVRFVYSNVFTEMFRQILRDKQVPEDYILDTYISLNYEAWYEKAKVKEDFEKALDLYETAKPLIGKLFSAETVIDRVFDMSASDVQDEFDKIKQEIDEGNTYYPIYQANKEQDDEY
uniref:Capsid assembly protein n=1 Tax=Myoviridae sp. ctqEN1 TaxID=2827709 RepID=A0A8S5S6H3_9CAUD|nr:MAG TPA: capsid assembly protein [Myoviridae sp. ctqEN1]DAX96125.1 MAG TPA: capsid assembly protein [Bacteriophage sp.]